MQKPDYQRFKTNLKHQIEENPVLSIGVFAAAATAAAKLIDANNRRRSIAINDREVARREYQTYHGKKR